MVAAVCVRPQVGAAYCPPSCHWEEPTGWNVAALYHQDPQHLTQSNKSLGEKTSMASVIHNLFVTSDQFYIDTPPPPLSHDTQAYRNK